MTDSKQPTLSTDCMLLAFVHVICRKARNVLLATGSTDGRGVVGKVGDFGLSLQMNHLETHISAVYQVCGGRW